MMLNPIALYSLLNSFTVIQPSFGLWIWSLGLRGSLETECSDNAQPKISLDLNATLRETGPGAAASICYVGVILGLYRDNGKENGN